MSAAFFVGQSPLSPVWPLGLQTEPQLSTPAHRKTRLWGLMEREVPERAVKSGLSQQGQTP